MAKFRSGDLVLTSTQRIIQGTNTILDATGVANFTSLEFDTGATISEFSIDPALTDDSDSKVSTQKAVRSYVDSQISGTVPTGTDESVVRYNGLNSVQDSLLFIDDSGNVTGVNDLIAGGTGDFEGHVAIGNDSVIHDRIVLRVQEDINNDTGAVGINVNVDNASNNAAAITTAISISMINSSTSHNILAGESIYVASSNNSGATVTEVKGVDITAGVTGDNTTIATMIGGEFNILSGFSMVNTQITDAIAGKFQLLNLGSGGISITNGYGVLIKTPGFNPSGTTDNLYGLYIEDQSTVGFTTDYNLYSAGVNSRNKIEGILEVESIDTTALVISGDIYCDELFTSGSTINVGTGQIKSTAGNIELYNAGIKTLSTGVDEIQIDSSLYPGNYTTITSNINGVYYRTGGNDATSHLHRFYGNDNTGPPGAQTLLMQMNWSGGAQLYFRGVQSVSTTVSGITTRGSGGDVVAWVTDANGNGIIAPSSPSTGVIIKTRISAPGAAIAAQFLPEAAVELYYNGVKKFETTLTGATITGDLAVSQVTGLDAPAALGEAIRQTANVTEVNLNILTGGGETTLHSHASVGDAAADVTFENLDANGDVGAGATQVSIGTHTHTGLPHSGLNDDQPTKHRLINDAGTSLTELWSASKINSVAGGAITTTTTSFADGAIAINTADTEILTGAITTIGGNVVISCNTGFYTPGTETEAEVTLKLYRDTTIIRTVLVGSSRGSDAIFDILRNNSSLIIIDNPGAGTYTYRLKAIRTGDAAIAAYRAMWIVELN